MSDRGVKLQELCSRMLQEGYNYASFQDIGNDDISLEPPLKETEKPDKGLYFSKLKHYSKDFGLSRSSRSSEDSGLSNSSGRSRSSRSGGEFVYPIWYKYVKDENHNVDKYEKKGIIFAKIDENRLKNVKSMNPIAVSNRFSLGPVYNWGDVKDECGIILYETDMKFIKENGWDIPQCVIWDTKCLSGYRIFKNTGRISYREVECKIKNMEKVDIIKKATEDFGNFLSSLSFWDKK